MVVLNLNGKNTTDKELWKSQILSVAGRQLLDWREKKYKEKNRSSLLIKSLNW